MSKITIATVNLNNVEGYAVFVRNIDDSILTPRINKWTMSFDKALEFANYYADAKSGFGEVLVYVTDYKRPMEKIEFSVDYAETMGA